MPEVPPVQLFDGEEIDFRTDLHPPQSLATTDDVNEKYIKGDVRIVTEQARYPLHTIVAMLDSGDYDLNPEFQRRHRWSLTKQSRLIESFIMNVPIPPIFLYEIEYSRYEVMDGLQRLTAIYDFYQGKYELAGLTEWPELIGKRYRQLPEQVRRGIDRRHLSSIILLHETAKSDDEALRLKQLVFERINSGGEKLEPQESRNALYNGPLNQLCIELASTSSFRKMWGIPTEGDFATYAPRGAQLNMLYDDEAESDEQSELSLDAVLLKNKTYQKMQDVELVLRFFAHRQLHRSRLIDTNPNSGSKEPWRLRDYLDEFLRKGNLRFTQDILDSFKETFVLTSNLVYELFGKSAFYLFRPRANSAEKWTWFERPAKVVYDPLMFAVSQRIQHIETLRDRASELRNDLKEFYISNSALFTGRSTNYQDIVTRRRLFLQYIDNHILDN